MVELTRAAKILRTQWATQFLAAAELVRRDYTVSFTLGYNTPVADLMVGTPSGDQFWVDVKGLASRTDWLLKPKVQRKNLFYVLVYLSPIAEPGKARQPDQFFVLTQAEANDLERRYRSNRPKNKTTMPGFLFSSAEAHRDRWDKLPRPE